MKSKEKFLLVEFIGDIEKFKLFLEGFFDARNIDFDSNVFFEDDYNLSHETFFEKITSFLGLNEPKHSFIASENVITYINEAIRKKPDECFAKLGTQKYIKKIEYPFSFEIFSVEIGTKIKEIFKYFKKVIKNLEFKEDFFDSEKNTERGVYTAEHRYVLKGSGRIDSDGEISDALACYRKLYRFDQVEIDTPKIELEK